MVDIQPNLLHIDVILYLFATFLVGKSINKLLLGTLTLNSSLTFLYNSIVGTG